MGDIRDTTSNLHERLTGNPSKPGLRPFDEGSGSGSKRSPPESRSMAMANPHAKYLHSAVCNLRLRYIPRQGSHGQSSKVQNPTMILRMLTTEGGDGLGTSICRNLPGDGEGY